MYPALNNECSEVHVYSSPNNRSVDRVTGASTNDAEAEWNDQCDCLHPVAVIAARKALSDAPRATDLAATFAILADPTRIRVLTALRGAELCVTDLAAATGINRTTVSHQLRVLRANRLVRRRRVGKVVYYALDDEHVTSLLAMASAHIAESTFGHAEEASA